jgi:hypothetical protein
VGNATSLGRDEAGELTQRMRGVPDDGVTDRRSRRDFGSAVIAIQRRTVGEERPGDNAW